MIVQTTHDAFAAEYADLPRHELERDVWWLSPSWIEGRLGDAGFVPHARMGRKAAFGEKQPQAFILVHKK